MQPPICDVCDEWFDPADGGRRIRFVATDAGRRFDERVERDGIVGDSPDEGWICARHADAADHLRHDHTRPDALRSLRASSIEPDPDTEQESREDPITAASERLARRQQSRITHALPSIPRHHAATEMRRTRDTALAALDLSELEPVTTSETSTAPSPEWRESATTTTIDTHETWASPDHEVSYRYRDTVWDGWSGEPRQGDLFQGAISLTIDDTRLSASFGPDGLVTSLVESGERTTAVADLIDDLTRRLGTTP